MVRPLTLGGGGVQADWNQNDETAPDYVKNRPGGYTKATPGYEITWDGVVGDKVAVDIGDSMQLVKVSDRVFATEELIRATMTVINDGEAETNIITEDSINAESDGLVIDGYIVIAATAPATVADITFPETGTYFGKAVNSTSYVVSLQRDAQTTTIKIPAELTTVVGGYDVAERTAAIFDGTIKASDFTEEGGK